MNPINTWIRFERMDEENPRFDEFKKEMDIERREDVEQFAALCAFKIFNKGAAVRFNKQIIGSTQKAYKILRFAGIYIDVLKFDDWFHTELNTIFLFELQPCHFNDALCPHCFGLLHYHSRSKMLECITCAYFAKP